MPRYFTLPLAALFLLAPCASACGQDPEPVAHPMLWKVTGNGSEYPSYLFGTIHVPDKRVKALAVEVRQAISSCNALYTEIKMDASLQAEMATASMNPAGVTLSQLVPEPLYKRLDAYLHKKGVPVQAFDPLKVWVVAMTLQMLDIQNELAREGALDMVLYQEADEAGMEVGGVETAEEQVGIFESFTLEEQIQYLDDTLTQLEEYEAKETSQLEELTLLYLAGNPTALMEKSFEDVDPEDPFDAKLIRLLLTDRNLRMADRCEKLMKDHPDQSYFFAFGTAHFPGKGGVIELLQKRGYTVERIGAPPTGESCDEVKRCTSCRKAA